MTTKKKRLIWLDDARNPLENDWLNFSPIGKDVQVVWLQSYEEFVKNINKHGLPDGICFDHDIADETKTGYDCAVYLISKCIDKGVDMIPFSVQSANPVGAQNIRSLCENYHKFFIENGGTDIQS